MVSLFVLVSAMRNAFVLFEIVAVCVLIVFVNVFLCCRKSFLMKNRQNESPNAC